MYIEFTYILMTSLFKKSESWFLLPYIIFTNKMNRNVLKEALVGSSGGHPTPDTDMHSFS